MADATVPAAPVSPAAEPVVAPAVAPAAPAVSPPPVAAPASAVEPAVTPAVEPAKPAEPAKSEPAKEPEPKSDAAASPDQAAPAPEAPKAADPLPAEPAQPAAPAFTFKMPEGLKAEPATIKAYENVLTKYGINNEAGQELMDFHANAIKQASDAMAQRQVDVFAETRKGWVKEFEKSAGNRRDTILNDAKWAIGEVVKDKKERQALWDVLAFTGAGDHPTIINAWAKVGKRLREQGAPAQGLATNGAKSGNPADRRYGGSRTTANAN